MQIELFNGAPGAWDAFVATQPAATASHLYGWRRVIERVYHHECPYLVARAGGRIQGVLPLVDVRSMAFGRFLVSMPFLNAGGPLGGSAAMQALTEQAVSIAAKRRAALVELRANHALETSLSDNTGKVGCMLALTSSSAAVWEGFPAKLRSQIRRAQKAGIEMKFGADQLAPFFTVFARNMRDLGSPTHPQSFFKVIAEELSDHVQFGCAYYEGKPVAAGCALQWRDELEMTWASSLREYSAHAPNMLLYWSFIERAANAGLKQFNFGRCTPGTGSHKFKVQWGTVDTQLHWYRATLRAGAATPAAEGGLSLATRIWQRVPVPLATMVGSRLRGGIPA